MDAWERRHGASYPLGAHFDAADDSWNFALYSRYASGVVLHAYTVADPLNPAFSYRFKPLDNKTARVWHCRIPEAQLNGATLYAYTVEGPFIPARGLRFDAGKILVDPYARALHFPPGYSRAACASPGSSAGRAPLGVLQKPQDFDWGDDSTLRHAHDLVIYEMHVRGFTRDPSSGVAPARRGTYLGVVERIPYLKELGITAVELLPVHQFDPQEGNYWGYMTLNFFSPHQAYASDPARACEEFKIMVRELHRAGIEVILDVVYNHTSEGNLNGPTYSFRGIDHSTYYLLERGNFSHDIDVTGTGNTLHTADPAVRALVLDSLRHWAEEYHIDGFRFDLASVFTRRSDGSLDLDDPPIISAIRADPRLSHCRLIAEAWDIASYQLGRSFPGLAWRQWNGQFRDDIRRFVKSDVGLVDEMMQRVYGSDALFPDDIENARHPWQSVNFIVAHDGFNLHDLVSYNRKHNLANGHNQTDGTDENHSWNCGYEGSPAPAAVEALRRRQTRFFAGLLFLSNGTPMWLAGDEFLHTQGGNNNPYNQDNPTTWLNWNRAASEADFLRYVRGLIAFRRAHPSIARHTYWREHVRWYGAAGMQRFGDAERAFAFFLDGTAEDDAHFYVMINAWWEALDFVVQHPAATPWRTVFDSAAVAPADYFEPGTEPALNGATYRVGGRSIVVLRADD
jgi:glycogen operon protein